MIVRDDRGQAYTLEGVIGALLVLAAVLFALQSVIITPTTSGTVDEDVRSELRQQARDILVISAQNESFGLSELARYWHESQLTFFNATNPRIGYGSSRPPRHVGRMLNETFAERSRLYNVYLRYQPANASGETLETPVVYRGEPSRNAVVASYSVTLYDNQTLTSPTASSVELWRYDTNATNGEDGYYPVPDAIDGPVYNVVEVRVIVW